MLDHARLQRESRRRGECIAGATRSLVARRVIREARRAVEGAVVRGEGLGEDVFVLGGDGVRERALDVLCSRLIAESVRLRVALLAP